MTLTTILRSWFSALALASVVAPGAALAQSPTDSLREQVFAAERAFARSMAERNFEAFGGFVANDSVFFSGKTPQRGRAAVLAGWKAFFDGPTAPFSWEPDQVEVLDSGDLAIGTGPVRDPQGKVVARFNSIWRRSAQGQWQVVFDKGSPPDPEPR